MVTVHEEGCCDAVDQARLARPALAPEQSAFATYLSPLHSTRSAVLKHEVVLLIR